jgi:hypothetical protein
MFHLTPTEDKIQLPIEMHFAVSKQLGSKKPTGFKKLKSSDDDL